MGETLDFIIREKEKKGVSITQSQADLVSAAEQLDKEGKHEYALEWMDKKKMSFSPSQLAVFLNIIAKTRGLDAAEAYFKKIDPNIDRMDTRSKNWPAYVTLLLLKRESKKNLAKASCWSPSQ
ncbi:PREDICTED: pentatricopeptide repeat-containing protein At1g02370, mitochondrial-like isoform X2 [Camelina sativa]|uniref:Pentatricopeptide repeat-containing protein At1g02370, mitochondrial-like isoform X2 n=1 Tax=Camelina sativa TaxID=90675 RepID=A0ABM0XYJ8_CAMSA|nr:PREDICTED: pentatricopeptide repeat-containing protein At1g02370, mitochondrial-like isoform X2 [Camelina sativa]